MADVGGAKGMGYWDECVPADKQALLGGSVAPEARDVLAVVEAIVARHGGRHPRLGWALAPSSPERRTRERLAETSRRLDLPVYTHIYESRAR